MIFMIKLSNEIINTREIELVLHSIEELNIKTNGYFYNKCLTWLINYYRHNRLLLVSSASQALEVAAMLVDCSPGDEVIVSTYSFPSTINPFLIRGVIPVLVEIDDSGCMDLGLLKKAINEKTKAVVVTNYAGWNENIGEIKQICDSTGLLLIEDNAQGFLSEVKGKALGSFGDVGIISFESTKAVSCGEGGLLIINNYSLWEKAQIIACNGTTKMLHKINQSIDYDWIRAGINCNMSEWTALLLYTHLNKARNELETRKLLAEYYFARLANLSVKYPNISEGWNFSMFYILTNTKEQSEMCKTFLTSQGIQALSHYGSLRESVLGKKMKYFGDNQAKNFDELIIRLPLHSALTLKEIEYICKNISLGLVL